MSIENKIRIQKEGKEAWFANYCKGTLAWATGVGKTKAALDIIEQLRHDYLQRYGEGMPQGLIVTPTEEMRDNDWPDEFRRWYVGTEGIKLICYASLAKENLSKYDFIVYDECHRITLKNLQKQKEANVPALGLTATYPRARYEDDKPRIDLLYEVLPPVHYMKTDDAVDLGLISNFEIVVLKFELDTVNKNVRGGTKAKPFMTTEKASYDYYTKSIRSAAMKSIDSLKFAYVSKRAQLIYNLPSRLRLAQQCLERLHQPGKRTLVFSGSIEQANALCGDNVYHSKSDDSALKAFQNREIDILGAVKALNEGKNLTAPDQSLIANIDGVERNLVQRIGRAIRRREDNLEFTAKIVILVAMGTADEEWYKTSIRDFDSSRIKEYKVKVPELTMVS